MYDLTKGSVRVARRSSTTHVHVVLKLLKRLAVSVTTAC